MEHEKEKLDQQEAMSENTENSVESPENTDAATETNVAGKLSELTEFKDKYLRLYADFENFRRRSAREKTELLKSASEDTIKSILPILDDFERALKSQADASEGQAAREGMQLIYNKLFKILEQKGLKPMESVGTEFNPEIHESIAQTPAPSDDLKGKVIDEVEKGYYLHDKVIRYAKTIVGA
jgi:molecular chaperone GrpE